MSSDTLFSGLRTSRKTEFLFFSPFLFYNSLDVLASFGRPALFIGFPPISSKGAPWPVRWSTCLSAPLFRQHLPVRVTFPSGKFLPSVGAPFFHKWSTLFFHKCHLSSTPFFKILQLSFFSPSPCSMTMPNPNFSVMTALD
jgi:hypothetical protein